MDAAMRAGGRQVPDEGGRVFSLRRVLGAPRHTVFRALTLPEHLGWFHNPAMPLPEEPIEVDLRVGGVWRQRMIVDDVLAYTTGGVYLEIVPDRRLVFRWGAVGGWPELAGEEGDEAPVVTIELHDSDSNAGTLLSFALAFPDRVAVETARGLIDGGCRDGWSATFDRLPQSTAFGGTVGQ